MTDEETQKLFTLLSQFYPNAKQLRSKDTLAAWRLALRAFPYDDVKSQVLRCAAREKFFPDLADLTAGLDCPTEAQAPPRYTKRTIRNARALLAYGRKQAELLAKAERAGQPPDIAAVIDAACAAYRQALAEAPL